MGISWKEGKFTFIPALCENLEVFSKPMDRHSHLASSQECWDLRGHPGVAAGLSLVSPWDCLDTVATAVIFGLPGVEKAS